jgi:hypothetical protein
MSLSATEIIEEIKRLPPGERERVRDFARERLDEGQLPAEDIGRLVQKMVNATDPAEKKRLEEEIVKGFYGAMPHA